MNIKRVLEFNTKKYHVFAPIGRFQLELIYLITTKGLQDRNINILDGTTVEIKVN